MRKSLPGFSADFNVGFNGQPSSPSPPSSRAFLDQPATLVGFFCLGVAVKRYLSSNGAIVTQ